MKLVSGPWVHAQNWSRGFYAAYAEIDGLYTPSSRTNRPAIVLYERASTSLFPGNTLLHGALADPLMHKALTVIVDEIRYGLV